MTNSQAATHESWLMRSSPRAPGFIFHGDSLSPLVFVLALIPLSLILRNAKAAYEFSGNKEKINHLFFMDGLKLYSRNEKGLDSLVQTVHVLSEDIGMKFGTEKCVVMLKI